MWSDALRSRITTIDPLVGHRALPVVGATMLVAFVVIRMAGSPPPLTLAWSAVGCLAALASPALGLLSLAAIGPFTEAVTDDGTITASPVILVALMSSTAVRWAATRAWPERSAALVFALIVLAGTGLGVLNTLRVFGGPEALASVRGWLAGPFAAFGLCLVAARVAGMGELRPLAVAIGSATLAALLSVAQFALPELLASGPLAALLRPDGATARLTGVIPAPNAAATLFLVPVAFLTAMAMASRDVRERVAAAATGLAALVATVLTLSRSAALALVAVVAVHGARARPWVGIVIILFGLLAAVAVVVGYGTLRPDAADIDGGVVTIGDVARSRGWTAALRMWLDEPLLGHGSGSFRLLHERYGAAAVTAPHNEWLRFFAEGGIVVGAAALGFLVAAARLLWRDGGAVAFGTLGVLAAYAVMASFNNPLIYIQVSVPVFVTLGTGLGVAARRADRHRGRVAAGREAPVNHSSVRDRPSSSSTEGS
jgi:putative inorganic carbon (hco3(-)) transporter